MDRLRVALLGCTGLVGQRFVQLLHGHPMFQLDVIAASERSAYRRYREVVRWSVESEVPHDIAEMEVVPVDPDRIPKVDLVFSALPADVASSVELELVRRGYVVISNASNARLEPDVPLVVPEINSDHLKLVSTQRRRRGWRGALIKNPNCSTIILTLTLKPLMDRFVVRKVVVTTMQALSGAGIGADGVLGMFILDNIIPYIRGEEEKVETESLKILGRLQGDEVRWASFVIASTTTRVPVLDGHLESVYVELDKNVTADDVMRAFEEFSERHSLKRAYKLPTAPERPIVVRREVDRPQPRLDRLEGNGMSVVVGRIREVKGVPNAIRYLVLGHNTIRGAAGNTILIGEVLVSMFRDLVL